MLARLLCLLLTYLVANLVMTGHVLAQPTIMLFTTDTGTTTLHYENGQPKGILADIVRYIEKQTGLRFEIKCFPWGRTVAMGTAGRGGILGISKTEARARIFDFSEPLYFTDSILVTKRGHEFPFETLEDLRGKRIGMQAGFRLNDTFEHARQTFLTIDEDANTTTARMKKLLAGRIDAVLVGGGQEGLYQALRNDAILSTKAKEFIALPRPLTRNEFYLAIPKALGQGDAMILINAAIKQGKQSGEFARIATRHKPHEVIYEKAPVLQP
ncbi:transporter substrate-binding domain-containing protein [Chitinivorax sp. B]|uniref:substrate-binding periplasmic protein n=1 Tax=Chitinivorax sp. B TaxID=2502235 RepID=UPI0014859706|nr:transporter substrate-binding domain-containing protein [Chitinivorax sp. B]